MEIESIGLEEVVEKNTHFHVGSVEFKGPMRHLGKDTEQRAGLQLVPNSSRHSVQLLKNHLDLTVIKVDKFGDNKERKQQWKFGTKSWGTIIFRNPTVEPRESLGKSERWKTNQERLAHESDQRKYVPLICLPHFFPYKGSIKVTFPGH